MVKAGKGKVTQAQGHPLVKGEGPKVQAGQQIAVNYVGVTYRTAGVRLVLEAQRPAGPDPIGAGQLIPGWDQGLVGVPVGSRVQLDIPAELAYGDQPGRRPAGRRPALRGRHPAGPVSRAEQLGTHGYHQVELTGAARGRGPLLDGVLEVAQRGHQVVHRVAARRPPRPASAPAGPWWPC